MANFKSSNDWDDWYSKNEVLDILTIPIPIQFSVMLLSMLIVQLSHYYILYR